jgi:GxxExxY protein
MLHQELTEPVLKAFYKVYNTLGYGFLEKVYENALAYELRRLHLDVQQQQPVAVYYDCQLVGDYFADIVVNGRVLLELKSAEAIHVRHMAQIMNYLKATEIEVGLLLNFGPEPSFKRRILTNDRKRNLKNRYTD